MRCDETGMKVVYDSEADVLYVTRDTPEYTEYIEHSEDVILRFDPDTKRLVGVTIIGFSQHTSEKRISAYPTQICPSGGQT